MVTDNRPHRPNKHLKRRASWKDTLRGLASPRGNDSSSKSPSPGSSRITTHRHPVPRPGGNLTEGDLADESSADEDAREEDRPLRARVRYSYHRTPTPPIFSSGLETDQAKLSVAVQEADSKATDYKSAKRENGKEPIGTRLTMTSRTGFFQDRVVSPSMVRYLLFPQVYCTALQGLTLDASHGDPIYWTSS
jgi:hypothetical protein